MNLFLYSLIFASVSLSVVAQILLKKGMSSPAVQEAISGDFIVAVQTILLNASVFSGLVSYVSSAAIWLVVLSKVDVSKAYPYVGLGFIGTMMFAYWFLNEPLTLVKVVGTLLIVSGVVVISQ